MTETTRSHDRYAGLRTPTSGAWIVGSDGSECAGDAVRWAVAHADGRASALRITTAWAVPVAALGTPFVEPVALADDAEAMERSAGEHARRAAAEARAVVSLPVDAAVIRGGAATVLLDAAQDASLLVVGSRGHGGFARLMLGSTSMQCATHATVPTVVVPEFDGRRPTADILVAIDGSENSLAALRWAIDFADAEAVIDCVSVWDVTPISVGADQFFFPEASDLALKRFDHQIDATLAGTGRGDVTVHRRFLEGRPRQVLAACAAQSDLLVMGARGHGAIGAAILGSMSTWLLHHVRCPMVVVPGDGGDDGFDGFDADIDVRQD